MSTLKLFWGIFSILTFNTIIGQKTTERNFFIENWKPRTYNSSVKAITKSLTTSDKTDVTIQIDTQFVIAPVLSTQFGANTNFRAGSDQSTRSNLYKGTINSMRFPAGSGSNIYFFDKKGSSHFNKYKDKNGELKEIKIIDGLSPKVMTPEIFLKFKKNIQGTTTVVVNYFYARYGTTTSGTREARVKQAADYAAAFVRKMNLENNGSVKYWEIGNECYGPWETGFDMPVLGKVTGTEYGEDFRVFAKAMKAVDPSIKLGAVLKEQSGSFDQKEQDNMSENWNMAVINEVKNDADFLIIHQYFTSFKSATAENIFASVSKISSLKDTIQSNVFQYSGLPVDYFPFALTEYNSRGVFTDNIVNGIFISQALAEIIKSKIGFATLWVLEWNYEGEKNGSHGLISSNNPDQKDYTPRPAFVPLYYYGKCFGDRMVQSSSSDKDVKSFASVFTSGEIGIVITNTSNKTKTISLLATDHRGKININKAQWYEYYGNTIDPNVQGFRKFYVNEITSNTKDGGPTNLDKVKPYEAAFETNSTITIKPYSVIYLILISTKK